MADLNIELYLKDLRLSFADIFEPKERKNDAGEITGYQASINLLVPKVGDPQAKAITEAMRQALELKWPGLGMKIPPDRRCFRDGEPIDPDTATLDDNGNPIPGTGNRAPLYDGYAGHYYLSANKQLKVKPASFSSPEEALRAAVLEMSKSNPVQILGLRRGADGKFPILHAGHPDAPYSGCYVNAIVRIYAYDGSGKGHPNRINCSLEALQFKRHGESFGAKPVDAQGQFEEQEGDDMAPATSSPAASAEVDDMMG